VLAGLEGLASMLRQAAFYSSQGGAGLVLLLVKWTFGFLTFALFLRVISSWIPPLAASRWVRWSYGATEWMLRPLRGLIPSVGGVIDITPIVAYFALVLLRSFVIEPILLAALR
jgi:YggT family protein